LYLQSEYCGTHENFVLKSSPKKSYDPPASTITPPPKKKRAAVVASAPASASASKSAQKKKTQVERLNSTFSDTESDSEDDRETKKQALKARNVDKSATANIVGSAENTEADSSKTGHWVRRSVREAGQGDLDNPHVVELLTNLLMNDENLKVLKLKKWLGPDANTLVMDAVLDGLEVSEREMATDGYIHF